MHINKQALASGKNTYEIAVGAYQQIVNAVLPVIRN